MITPIATAATGTIVTAWQQPGSTNISFAITCRSAVAHDDGCFVHSFRCRRRTKTAARHHGYAPASRNALLYGIVAVAEHVPSQDDCRPSAMALETAGRCSASLRWDLLRPISGQRKLRRPGAERDNVPSGGGRQVNQPRRRLGVNRQIRVVLIDAVANVSVCLRRRIGRGRHAEIPILLTPEGRSFTIARFRVSSRRFVSTLNVSPPSSPGSELPILPGGG